MHPTHQLLAMFFELGNNAVLINSIVLAILLACFLFYVLQRRPEEHGVCKNCQHCELSHEPVRQIAQYPTDGKMAVIEADCAIAYPRFVKDLPWIEAAPPAPFEEDPEYRDFYSETSVLVSEILSSLETDGIIGKSYDKEAEEAFFNSPAESWLGHLCG